MCYVSKRSEVIELSQKSQCAHKYTNISNCPMRYKAHMFLRYGAEPWIGMQRRSIGAETIGFSAFWDSDSFLVDLKAWVFLEQFYDVVTCKAEAMPFPMNS